MRYQVFGVCTWWRLRSSASLPCFTIIVFCGGNTVSFGSLLSRTKYTVSQDNSHMGQGDQTFVAVKRQDCYSLRNVPYLPRLCSHPSAKKTSVPILAIPKLHVSVCSIHMKQRKNNRDHINYLRCIYQHMYIPVYVQTYIDIYLTDGVLQWAIIYVQISLMDADLSDMLALVVPVFVL